MAGARARAQDTLRVPSPEIGALLRFLADTVAARSIVEVGSGGGVSGLYLLGGMPPEGSLTSIESDRHAHELAAAAFSAAGSSARVRAIVGDPAMVLPRLSDAGYDLLLAQGAATGAPAVAEHAPRLLRPGGVLVVCGTLAGDDLRARVREDLEEDEHFSVVTLPLDGGTTLATLRRT